MIVSNIVGGLGNQMFQYAVAVALAYDKGDEVGICCLDYQNASHNMHNGYELDRVFGIRAKQHDENLLSETIGWQAFPPWRKLLRKRYCSNFRSPRYIVEPSLQYWPALASKYAKIKDCYVVGYWQSEKYFKKIAPSIRDFFKFKQNMSDANKHVLSEIKKSNSVSLHVRRGDYLTSKSAVSVHGTCTANYYQDAINEIAERHGKISIFAFSDDIDWVRSNIKSDYSIEFVDCNTGSDSYWDMMLMSNCKHNIIANSTFSWWGAWLNPHENKTVVAPKDWFRREKNIRHDLIPDDWVCL